MDENNLKIMVHIHLFLRDLKNQKEQDQEELTECPIKFYQNKC
jgi:hypothetical protein